MNTEDASRFEELVRSPIRSEERESAIKQWHTYKAGKQMAFVQQNANTVTKFKIRTSNWLNKFSHQLNSC